MKKLQWLFIVFPIGCLLPYFIPALNSIYPKAAGIPFTVWSIEVWLFLCCLFLLFCSRKIWDSYDGEEEL